MSTDRTDKYSRFAIACTVAVTLLLGFEIVFFICRSGLAVMVNVMRCSFLCFSTSGIGELAIASVCISFVIGLFRKRSLMPIHMLAIVPWLFTLGSLIWSGYWTVVLEVPHSESRNVPELIPATVLAFLSVSLGFWIILLILRRQEWLWIVAFASLQLILQTAIAFISLMAISNQWL